jgi:hypothetical protein
VGKPERKLSLGIRLHRFMNNIWINLRETGWGVMDWIVLAQDRAQRRAQ